MTFQPVAFEGEYIFRDYNGSYTASVKRNREAGAYSMYGLPYYVKVRIRKLGATLKRNDAENRLVTHDTLAAILYWQFALGLYRLALELNSPAGEARREAQWLDEHYHLIMLQTPLDAIKGITDLRFYTDAGMIWYSHFTGEWKFQPRDLSEFMFAEKDCENFQRIFAQVTDVIRHLNRLYSPAVR